MISRREIFRMIAASLAGGSLPFGQVSQASSFLRLSLPGTGSAGSVWHPLIQRDQLSAINTLNPQWVGGNPGQIEVQLLSGALDVAAFGTVGACQSIAHGADIVIFGPALHNHGRWIVRGDSPYHTPRDLIGKPIATQPENSETYLQARIAAALNGIDLRNDYQVIFGPPTANLALFQRGDVDAVILLEPTATRLVAAGAREIARVGDMWRKATGQSSPPFLVGQASQRSWYKNNQAIAGKVAALFIETNFEIQKNPKILSEFHLAMGIPSTEKNAIELLPSRMDDVYATDWGPSVFQTIEKQVEFAVKLGILPSAPSQKFYVET